MPGVGPGTRFVGSARRWLLCVALLAAACTRSPKVPVCAPGSLLSSCREHCQSDGDCLAPARCEPTTSTCQRPAIACDPLAEGGTPTGSGTGDGGATSPDGGARDGCPTGQECDLVTRTCTPRPGALCKEDGDCRAGEVCGDATCVPAGSAALCQRNSDCTPPNVCRLTLAVGGGLIVQVCGAAIGPGEPGARCRGNPDCQSGVCLRTGVCFSGCTAATALADCHGHSEVVCGQVPFVLRRNAAGQPTVSVVTGCALAPPACTSDRDCETPAAGGGTCQLLVDPTQPASLRTGCLPSRGTGRPSASCRRDSDCESGLCQSGSCFAACQLPTDCQAGYGCHPAVYEVDGVTGSVASCVLGP